VKPGDYCLVKKGDPIAPVERKPLEPPKVFFRRILFWRRIPAADIAHLEIGASPTRRVNKTDIGEKLRRGFSGEDARAEISCPTAASGVRMTTSSKRCEAWSLISSKLRLRRFRDVIWAMACRLASIELGPARSITLRVDDAKASLDLRHLFLQLAQLVGPLLVQPLRNRDHLDEPSKGISKGMMRYPKHSPQLGVSRLLLTCGRLGNGSS
jgi:hypothetical protein